MFPKCITVSITASTPEEAVKLVDAGEGEYMDSELEYSSILVSNVCVTPKLVKRLRLNEQYSFIGEVHCLIMDAIYSGAVKLPEED